MWRSCSGCCWMRVDTFNDPRHPESAQYRVLHLDELHRARPAACQPLHVVKHPQEGVAKVVDHGDGVAVLQERQHGVAACFGVAVQEKGWWGKAAMRRAQRVQRVQCHLLLGHQRAHFDVEACYLLRS